MLTISMNIGSAFGILIATASLCHAWSGLRNRGRSATCVYGSTIINEITVTGKRVAPKVPSNAWRWPQSWPFGSEQLDTVSLPVTLAEEWQHRNAVTKAVSQHCASILPKTSAVAIIHDYRMHLTDPIKTYFALESFPVNLSDPFVLLKIPPQSADALIIFSGVELMCRPLETYKQLWAALKPDGVCMTVFSSNPALPSGSQPVKMWTSMSDEQKVWVAGSYFHYSAIEGWENIEGFDLHDSAEERALVFDAMQSGEWGSGSVYVVQARKRSLPPLNFGAAVPTLADAIRLRLAGLPNLRPTDGTFVSQRLAALVSSQPKPALDEAQFETKISTSLPAIYEVLQEVSDAVVPPVMKSLLAVLLLETWTPSDRQVQLLRTGLGLGLDSAPPEPGLAAKALWDAIAPITSDLGPRERLYLLADVVAKAESDRHLQQLPEAITKVLSALGERLEPEVSLPTLQASAVDLVLSEGSSSAALDRTLRYLQICTRQQAANLLVKT